MQPKHLRSIVLREEEECADRTFHAAFWSIASCGYPTCLHPTLLPSLLTSHSCAYSHAPARVMESKMDNDGRFCQMPYPYRPSLRSLAFEIHHLSQAILDPLNWHWRPWPLFDLTTREYRSDPSLSGLRTSRAQCVRASSASSIYPRVGLC